MKKLWQKAKRGVQAQQDASFVGGGGGDDFQAVFHPVPHDDLPPSSPNNLAPSPPLPQSKPHLMQKESNEDLSSLAPPAAEAPHPPLSKGLSFAANSTSAPSKPPLENSLSLSPETLPPLKPKPTAYNPPSKSSPHLTNTFDKQFSFPPLSPDSASAVDPFDFPVSPPLGGSDKPLLPSQIRKQPRLERKRSAGAVRGPSSFPPDSPDKLSPLHAIAKNADAIAKNADVANSLAASAREEKISPVLRKDRNRDGATNGHTTGMYLT